MLNTMYHIPALLNETIDGLNIKPNGVYVDATFGGGGHAQAILDKLDENGKLYAFDHDIDVKENLIKDDRFHFIPHNFRHIRKFLRLHKIDKVDGILGDLGISSHQINEADRGFATRFDATLDMRMNATADLSAFEVINNYSQEQLADVIYYFGELNNARKLASIIVEKRKEATIETTAELIAVIEPWIKGKRNRYLAQLFQALRIEVNQELEALKELLEQSMYLVKPKGRLAIISWHSLEDRLVKNFIRSGNTDGRIVKDLFGNYETPFKPINKKVIIPTDKEVEDNPRTRSAKLRIAERL